MVDEVFAIYKPKLRFKVSSLLQLARWVYARPRPTGMLSKTCLQLQPESPDIRAD